MVSEGREFTYGQSFRSVPQRDAPGQRHEPTTHAAQEPPRLISEDRYGPTPSGPLLPRAVKRPRRSSPRLKAFDYTGPYAYSVTMNTDGDLPHFARATLTGFSLTKLLDLASAHHFEILAYCFMPTHLHLLAQGATETSRLKPFMQKFKQITGYAFRVEHQASLWHRSYHDHVARTDGDLHDIAAYIWANPVVAGLVERVEDYPYSGPRSRIAAAEPGPQLVRDDAPTRGVVGQSLSSARTADSSDGDGPTE